MYVQLKSDEVAACAEEETSVKKQHLSSTVDSIQCEALTATDWFGSSYFSAVNITRLVQLSK